VRDELEMRGLSGVNNESKRTQHISLMGRGAAGKIENESA